MMRRSILLQIYLIPMHKFIGVNNLKEVTDPIIFEKGNVPAPGGVLSTEIFGITAKERRWTYAYINLHGHYLTPFVYKMLVRMNRNFEDIIRGTKRFIIDKDGVLQPTEDESKGQTGIEFLYKNWEKIKFARNNSNIRGERIDLLEAHPKSTLFVEYWDVIPAYLRDANLQSVSDGKPSHHEINLLYSKLIRLASTSKNSAMFDFALLNTQYQIQSTLVEIYDLIKSKLEKKNGLIRKSLLGKSVDYGARSVISAQLFKDQRPEDMEINFKRCSLPLAQCCSLFTPYITAWVRDFFRREIERLGSKIPVYDKDSKTVKYYLEVEDVGIAFSEDVIKKALDRFVYTAANRFEKIEIPIKESSIPKGTERKKRYLNITGYDAASSDNPEDKSPIIDRAATWTDIFYMAAHDITQGKHVWITRYPLLDYFGMFPNKISVASTNKTMPMYYNGTVYTHYPVVDFDIPKGEMSTYFIDTLRFSSLYLAGLDGDFDGD